MPSPQFPGCRLPAMLWSYPIKEAQGGFIDTASGAFTPDPASVMVFDAAKGLFRTSDQPYLYGNWSDSNTAPSTYDAILNRWLPVSRQYVAPDGKTYAYAIGMNSPGGGVHLVDVATGADRIAPSTTQLTDANYFVVGYLKDGVYLDRLGPTGGARIGLWRLDPATDTITQVSTDSPALGILVGETPLISPPSTGNPDAWWTTDANNFTDTSDPNVYFQYLTGAEGQHGEDWFNRSGFHMDVVGADGDGGAIVQAVSGGQAEVWLLTTPNSATQLGGIAVSAAPARIFKTAVADRGGWWIGSSSGLFFASVATWARVSTTAVVVVGACQ